MEIKPTYVTFEQAKLLKEKGFGIGCEHYYEHALTSKKDIQDGYGGPFGWKKGETHLQSTGFFLNSSKYDSSNKSWFLCEAPEQWQVIEWLRINHGIWIGVLEHKIKGEGNYYESIVGVMTFSGYNSPQETYSAAFDYVLNNLI